MITCGVDIGSRTVKVVLFDGSKMLTSGTILSGRAPQEKAVLLMNQLLTEQHCTFSDVAKTVATGYGRNFFAKADKVSSEIICHTAGVAFLCPDVSTIIDIGGQDSKVIQVSPQGKVVDFVMNDRCAAGTGKFIEMVAQTLELTIQQTGSIALVGEKSCDISSMCAVFAESEVNGLLHNGTEVDVILRGVFKSVAKRVIALGRKLNFSAPIVFTGGVAQNQGVLAAIQAQAEDSSISIPEHPQLTGALGAAIIGYNSLNKEIPNER
ncbi:acyl-CoA dehydratase activase [Aliivibrio kagoshimensis]|uniref:acyl-CoA dehydratase activase n=1 Tax=Aliivibrio kagoshimensis TaxID=2910230 RepID=UPI003D11AD24